jgi:predicted nuclease with TOPRIM domain
MIGAGVKIDFIPVENIPIQIKSTIISSILEKLKGISSSSAMKIEFENAKKATSSTVSLKAYLKKVNLRYKYDISNRGKFTYISLSKKYLKESTVQDTQPIEDNISSISDFDYRVDTDNNPIYEEVYCIPNNL